MHTTEAIQAWYFTDEGQRFQADLTSALSPTIERTFGYNAVQLSVHTPDILAASPINNTLKACHSDANVICDCSALPFHSESMDLLVLCHSLECSDDPHAVLREVERVLVGEGSLIIIGLTPYSMSYATNRLKEIRQPLSRYSNRRVTEWLDVLGFETTGGRKIPIDLFKNNSSTKLTKLRSASLNTLSGIVKGHGYFIHAKKRITRITPVTPRWYRKPRLIVSNKTEPASNTSASHFSRKPEDKT